MKRTGGIGLVRITVYVYRFVLRSITVFVIVAKATS